MGLVPAGNSALYFARGRGNRRQVIEQQETPVPQAGARLRLRDIGWLVRYSLAGLAELVRARIVFARLKARDVPARNRAAVLRGNGEAVAATAHTARISFVIPRLSRYLPWRSDCMIQAIAAQNWLARDNFASEIQIGVERPDGAPFGAHAWLVHDGRIVTGGDIAKYAVILGEAAVEERGQGIGAG